MLVTAWNKGNYNPSGAGYGIRISKIDRDKYFKKKWKYIVLELEGKSRAIKVNTNKLSFWKDCTELINKDIGIWLIRNGKAPWKKNFLLKWSSKQ